MKEISCKRNARVTYMDLEPNLDLWPTKCIEKYIFRSHISWLVEGCWDYIIRENFYFLIKTYKNC